MRSIVEPRARARARGWMNLLAWVLVGLGASAACRAPLSVPSPPPTTREPGAQLRDVVFDLVRAGEVDGLREYLSAGYDPNATSARGDTLLTVAAYAGQLECVELLLASRGIDVDRQSRQGFTALIGAAYQGRLDIASRLLDAGAKPDATNTAGQTALMYAAMFDRRAIAELLVARGASVSRTDAEGRSAAGLARAQGADELADWLERLAGPTHSQ